MTSTEREKAVRLEAEREAETFAKHDVLNKVSDLTKSNHADAFDDEAFLAADERNRAAFKSKVAASLASFQDDD